MGNETVRPAGQATDDQNELFNVVVA